jgi:hypothetical protein
VRAAAEVIRVDDSRARRTPPAPGGARRGVGGDTVC